MNDKRQLLDELTIDADQRGSGGGAARFLLTGFGALLLVTAAWFILIPDTTALSVDVAVSERASGSVTASVAAVLDASGYVTARRQATVSSKITGKVIEVLIEEGMAVSEGQLLARLDDTNQRAAFELSRAQIRAAESRLDEVRVQIEESELELERVTELRAKNLASSADLDTTRLTLSGRKARLRALEREVDVSRSSLDIQRLALDDTQIKAPFDGVVVTKAAQPGEMISPVSGGGGFTRTGICTLVDMASLEVEVDVNESYINRVVPGQPVMATLNSYPDWQIPAEVIAIIPTADRNKATVRVRVGFQERDGRILPDMGVRVSFLERESLSEPEETKLTGVLVPGSAIDASTGINRVFVVKDDRIEIRTVTLGPRHSGKRNVTDGLRAGERVVTGLSLELVDQLRDDRLVSMQSG